MKANNDVDSLKQTILEYDNTGQSANAKLLTDDKVLARVTDGIYRQPGSALRELISNAYDADAENVYIDTGSPRFETMTIKDDGNGMSIDTLLNLISHIGGSAKRNTMGTQLGVNNIEDMSKSPNKKRKLIGKIGIGLFSVAQLTREFEIITKEKDTDFYLKALITLHNYSDDSEPVNSKKDERGESFETGNVEIWTEKTKNLQSHGTDIILRDIKKSARDVLKSLDIWGQTEAQTESDDNDVDILDSAKLVIPSFHIGCATGKSGLEIYDSEKFHEPKLPWELTDSRDEKFKNLYSSVLGLTAKTVNPKLNIVLDNYLHMLWVLSLSIPLDYINKHPYELSSTDFLDAYLISNKHKGQVENIPSDKSKKPFKTLLSLKNETESVDFNVIIDDVKLYRPIDPTITHPSSAIIKKPLFFIGSYTPNLSNLNTFDSGGKLSFDAYILWTPKVIPRDHNGVLVRLHNASGIMFDETFMKHQVAEHTIKSQLTIEVFVRQGLDSALNIDRESFNVSHPHYQILMKWLHQALRQVINKYKTIKKSSLEKDKDSRVREAASRLDKIIDQSFTERGLEPLEKKPLAIASKDEIIKDDSYRVSPEVFKESIGGKSQSTTIGRESKIKTQAMFQILDSYGLLDALTPEKQERLFNDIMRIIGFKGE